MARNDQMEACGKVPTETNCTKSYELIGCYESKSQQKIANQEIAEVCRKHLANAQFSDGFRIRNCARREAQTKMIIVESILDFSFTEKSYTITRKAPIDAEGITISTKEIPFFFIEFGGQMEQSSLRGESGGTDLSSDDPDKKTQTIGHVLSPVAEQSFNGSLAKSVHFIPPLISNETNLMPYENYPNKTIPMRCDLLGKDCEATREILRKTRKVLECCSPSNAAGPCICKLLKPDLCYQPEKKKRRRKRQAQPNLSKWTKFPIAIRFSRTLGDPIPSQYLVAVEQGIKLIMDKTCITFTTDLSQGPDEGIEIYDKKDKVCGRSPFGHINQWQRVSISCTDSYTVAHEFLHALALWHEQDRDDANKYIKLNPTPRNQKEPAKTENYGFPYDFHSILHYAANKVNGYYDMITLNRFYPRTMFHSTYELSFKDAAIINKIYCDENCKNVENKCQKGGYPNPKIASNAFVRWDTGEKNAKWSKMPKDGKKVITKLKWLNEKVLSCGDPCGTFRVEITYRKDKRARDETKNWIEADAPDEDIHISAYINSSNFQQFTELFELTYETGMGT
ncbi:hypothetical protein niasHS_012837 [Heterodera schachtii]|uniref:Metalloendopeptidase n=1 Tax=Heterodera schachtii TaxID=97005 RepID=A0ABD2IDK9_HETSC